MMDETSFNPKAAAMGMRTSGMPERPQRSLRDMFAIPSMKAMHTIGQPRPRELSPEDMQNAKFDKAQAERKIAGTVGGAIASYFTGVPGLSRLGSYAVPKIDAEHERFIRRYAGNKDSQDSTLLWTSPGAFMTSPNISDSDKIMTGLVGLTPNQVDARLNTIKDLAQNPLSAIDDIAHNAFKTVTQNPVSVLNPMNLIPSTSKIVCTAMNDCYGFGKFRQTVWLKHSASLHPAYEKGYHTLFLPLVKLAYKKQIPIVSKITQRVLEHVARHRTVDIRAEMRNNKRDTLGRLYRAILEPICYFVGKGKV